MMHNPQNVELIVKKMKDVQYIDLEINSRTHGQKAIKKIQNCKKKKKIMGAYIYRFRAARTEGVKIVKVLSGTSAKVGESAANWSLYFTDFCT